MTQAGILDDYLTKADLAAQLDISPRTLERWARLRTGPAVTKVGVAVLYHRADLAEWLKAQCREAKPKRTRAVAMRQPIRPKTGRR